VTMVHWFDLLKLTIAYALALPIAFEREREERSAGLRTFPLMALASCGVILIGVRAMPGAGVSRILQGLLAGIGVICAGAIIHSEARVHGTSTAAGILGTAVLGAATAFGMFDVAVFLAVIMFLTLRLFRPLKDKFDANAEDREPGRPDVK
jgi:putative Mg2+ transporter-C (MgtC) family protein